MNVLLDESLPRGLADLIEGHRVETVQGMGWASVANGELLRRAATELDVLVTADQGLPHQQNLSSYELGVVVLAARTNRLEDLVPLVPALLSSLSSISAGEATRVEP